MEKREKIDFLTNELKKITKETKYHHEECPLCNNKRPMSIEDSAHHLQCKVSDILEQIQDGDYVPIIIDGEVCILIDPMDFFMF